MFLKLFSFIYLIFSIYILFQNKKRAKEETITMAKNLRQIKKMKKFKNTKDIRSRKLIQVVRIINRKKILIYLHRFFSYSSLLIFGFFNLIMGPLFFLLGLFLLSIFHINGDLNKIYKPYYKIIKVIEIILLILVIYG